jgi:hypothetical protein
MFFKIMPKVKKGNLVMPNIQITNTGPKAQGTKNPSAENSPQEVSSNETKSSFFKRFKWAILVVILLALGVLAYFILPKFFVDDIKSTNLLPAPNSNTSQKPDLKKLDWLKNYFKKPDCDASVCGDAADPDTDGLTNAEEYKLATDPNNPDSDKDGIADGDEAHAFGSNPLDDHSGINKSYFDQDYAKGG